MSARKLLTNVTSICGPLRDDAQEFCDHLGFACEPGNRAFAFVCVGKADTQCHAERTASGEGSQGQESCSHWAELKGHAKETDEREEKG